MGGQSGARFEDPGLLAEIRCVAAVYLTDPAQLPHLVRAVQALHERKAARGRVPEDRVLWLARVVPRLVGRAKKRPPPRSPPPRARPFPPAFPTGAPDREPSQQIPARAEHAPRARPAASATSVDRDLPPDEWTAIFRSIRVTCRRRGRRRRLLLQDAEDAGSKACLAFLTWHGPQASAASRCEQELLARMARRFARWAVLDTVREVRKRSRTVHSLEDMPGERTDRHDPPDRAAERAELVAELQRRIERLPRRMRAIFEAKHCCDGPSPSNTALATRFGISVRAVQKQLAEARDRILKKKCKS